MTIRLLPRVDAEATRRFENCIEGNVAKHVGKKSLELEKMIRLIVERYNKHGTVVDSTQFLDNISSAHIEFYHNGKRTRRDISLNVVVMSIQHIDEAASVLDEQNRYGPLEDSAGECDFIERYATAEVLSDSTVDHTLNEEVMTEIDEESSFKECQGAGEAPSQQQVQTREEKKQS